MKEFIYRIKDNFVDLSNIKTFKLSKQYSNDKEKRIIIIELKDRIQFINRDDWETINDKIEIYFEDQKEAEMACDELREEWQQYLSEKKTQ